MEENTNPWLTPYAKGYKNIIKKKEIINEEVCYNNIINYDGTETPNFYNLIMETIFKR